MSMITDEMVDSVWGNSDFGDVERMDVIRFSLLKVASGFLTGHRAMELLRNLNLVTKNNMLSKSGRINLYLLFRSEVCNP